MERDVEKFVKSCHGCQLVSWPNPPEPVWSTLMEFVMKETRHTWRNIDIRMFLMWGIWRQAVFSRWINWWSSNWGQREEMGAQRGAETDEAAELPIKVPQVNVAEKPWDPEVPPDQHTRQDQDASLRPHAPGRPHREKRMPRKYKDFCQIV